jgi:putative MATE family efflux protein
VSEGTRRARLIEGPVGSHLWRLGVPMAFGFLFVLLFQIVDTFWVGQLGTEQLAAIGYTFPVGFLIMSIALGLAVGTASVLSRAIGAGEEERATRLATDAIGLAIVIVVPVSVIGLLTIDQVFGAMGAAGRVLQYVRDYMGIWYPGVGMLFMPIVGNAAIRATGDTRTPAVIMGISGGMNMVLDPLMIFGLAGFPRMEVQGAAIATVISWGLTSIAAIALLRWRERLIDLRPPAPSAVLESWREILFVAGPAAATSMVVPVSAAVLTAIISRFGDEAVAAYGVGVRIEPIAMIGILALGSALPVFVGQNWGAGRYDRVREGLRLAQRFGIAWGFGVWLVLFLLRWPLAAAFNDDPGVVGLIADFLRILPASYGLLAINLLTASALNALNRPLQSAAWAVTRMFVLTVPIAWGASRWYGVDGVFYGAALANALAGVLTWLWFRRYLDRLVAEAKPGEQSSGVVND